MEENEEKNVVETEKKENTKNVSKSRATKGTSKKKTKENDRLSGVLKKIEEIEEEEGKVKKKSVKKEAPKNIKPKTVKKTKSTSTSEKEKKNTVKNGKTKQEKVNKKVNNTDIKVKENIENKNENKQKKIHTESKNINKKSKALISEEDIKVKELEEIKEAIKKQREVPKNIKNEMDKKVFENTIIAIGVLIYLILINIGFIYINPKNFIIIIRTFAIIMSLISIAIFEIAYKKDSGRITINGIEILMLAIVTMLLPRLYKDANNIFMLVVGTISMLFAVYYQLKAIIDYIKLSKKVRKSDASKIIKK